MKVKDYRSRIENETASPSTAAAATEAANADNSGTWQGALQVLLDGSADKTTRLEALRILAAGMFAGIEFAPYRPRFQDALRTIAADSNADPALRQSALGALINMKDVTARTLLSQGLRQPASAAVPPAVALEMLSLDDHASAAGLAREALASSREAAVRQQAVRILGADPSAKEQLRGILNDKNEFREVRRASAVALRSLEPTAFRNAAEAILADPGDFPDIKATLKGALDRSR